jgi:4'-phosphopantetheinyl transferase
MGCKTAPTAWPARSAPPELAAAEVHLWALPLDLAPAASVLSVLSEEEQARARRLVPTAGAQFAAARSALRTLLGAYLRAAPASLVLGVSAAGKPFLEDASWLRFNLAHSDALGLVAVAREIEVGVDVERRRAVRDAAALAARYFAPEEARELANLPEEMRSDAFLRCWTLKEAVLKATGEGLSQPLDSFRVAGAPAGWSLHALEPGTGYLGALAAKTPTCRRCCFTLDHSALR